MPYELFEIAVNIAEPLLLFMLLMRKLSIKLKALPFAVIGIFLLAAATTIMNKLGLDYVAVIIIFLVLYCSYSLLLFCGSTGMRLIWPALMVYIIAFSNTLVFSFFSSISAAALTSALQPSVLRIVGQIMYLVIAAAFVVITLKATRHIQSFSNRLAFIALFSCIVCIVSMYLLLDSTGLAAEKGVDTLVFGIIAILMMTVTLLLLVMIGQTNKWAAKYSEERIEMESLRKELQYNKEMTMVSQTIRQLKHAYYNHLSVISVLTADGNLEELKKYMSDYDSEYGIIDRYAITGDNVLDSLLSYKKLICDAESIDFRVSVFSGSIGRTGLSSTELSSLFGNLIDNSINACRRLDPEKRIIVLTIRELADMLEIRIINDRIEEEPEQKDGVHGLGLPRIRGIVERHKGICTIAPEKTRFTVDILLPNYTTEANENDDQSSNNR